MYIGATTRLEPAPMPDMNLPNDIVVMLKDRASTMGPDIENSVQNRMVSSRPYLELGDPADRAPTRPPTVNADDTNPN